MNYNEIEQLIEALSTSQDFLQSLQCYYENTEPNNLSLRVLALYFFSEGYISCLEHQEKNLKNKFHRIL